jgi:pyruvate dehydrogenase E2 component (dihydrolipoamide acetyltransferase)
MAAERPLAVAIPGEGEASTPSPVKQIDFSRFGEIETRPLGKIRRVSAANLSRSWQTVPHVTQHDEADVTELEAFRKRVSEQAKERGLKPSPLHFLMKAVALALREFPDFRSSLAPDGQSLILKNYFHLGIAVDTEQGLVVPVVRSVDEKGIFEIAAELAELAERARARKLRPEEMQGACFTISSLGGIGGTHFTPIVNAPEVAILGASALQTRPLWQAGEAGEEGHFAPRRVLPLSLSYDHRVIDGAEAVRFTTRLKGILERPVNLLL